MTIFPYRLAISINRFYCEILSHVRVSENVINGHKVLSQFFFLTLLIAISLRERKLIEINACSNKKKSV